MSLGVTWWHGAVGNPNGTDERPFIRRDEEKELQAWEATEAWNGKRRPLEKEANEILKRAGITVTWDGFVSGEVVEVKSQWADEDLPLIAAVILILSES